MTRSIGRPYRSIAASWLAACVVASLVVAGPAPAAPPPEGRWERATERLGPTPRDRSAMAYDPIRNEILLFGGISRKGKQDGTWVRRAGSWERLDPAVSPPLRTGAAMAFDSQRGEIVLFGGHTDEGRVADTWTWNGERWLELTPETSPSGRSFAGMAYDDARGEIVLFGGLGAAGGSLSDTWTWDGETWTEEHPVVSPPRRDGAGLAYDAARAETVLYGGFGQGGPRGDTWTWDGTDWTQETPALSPPIRNSAGMAYDQKRTEVVLFGGIDNVGARSDTWTWDGSTWTRETPAAAPQPRSSLGMAYDAAAERTVVFGGASANLQRDDTWTWDGSEWTTADPPTPEARHSAVFERDATGKLILFGGQVDQGLVRDTWTWDEGWRKLSPATSPPARHIAAAAYDAERGELVLFGGMGAGGQELGDTWIWDGTTWSERSPTVSPPPRHNAAMAYDSHRKEIVLFGGSNRDFGLVFDDTWTWDGTKWSLETPESSPPARSAPAMAFDTVARRTVMFGGYNANAQPTDTTWLWTGQNWIESFFGDRPPPRTAAAMTLSVDRNQILLFGGNTALGQHLSDLWRWTGEQWKVVVGEGGPEGRWGAAFAHHLPSGENVLFGGNANVFLDDTWTWKSSVPKATKHPRSLWTRHAAGWLREFALADLDDDDRNEIVIGGFGVGALDENSLASGRYRWMNKWPDQADPAEGDDNELAYDIDTDDVTGDGVPDTIAGTSMGLMAFDGRDGKVLYRVANDGTFDHVWELGTGDFNGDGVKDAVYSFLSEAPIYVADGRDGSTLWEGSRSSFFTAQIDTDDLNEDGTTDALVIGSGGFGDNVVAYSGATSSQTGVGTPLWSKSFPGGDPAVFRIGQIVAGGPKEIVVGGYNGEVEVLNATTGTTLGTWNVESRIADLALVQSDADADLEIAVAAGFNDDNGESTVVLAFDPLGQSLWSYDARMPPVALDVVDLDGDGSDELLVGGGFYEFRGRAEKDGFVAALDPHSSELQEGVPVERWRVEVPTRVGYVEHGSVMGEPTVLVGEDIDPYLRGLTYEGSERFTYRLGGHPRTVSAVDVDGDGHPNIIEGATDAEVAVHDHSGNTLWHARVPGKATPDIEAVHAGQLTDDPGLEVVTGTFEFARGEGGYVRTFTSDGRPLWSDSTAGPVGSVLAEDLDHDNRDEVLVANSGAGLGGAGAQIARYAGDGSALWKTPTPPSLFGPLIETARVNGDEVDDVIVLTIPFGRSFVLAYDGATGAELWRFDPESVAQWLDVSDDPGDGIAIGDMRGQVFRLDLASGAQTWRAEVENPSRGGTWTDDVDGDGIREIATSGDSGLVHLLGGADGAVQWSRSLDGSDWGYRVAPIEGTDGNHIAVGSYSNSNGQRSGVYFFDPESGDRVARFETEGHVLDIEPVDVDGDGNEEAVTAAGLQIYAIDLHAEDVDPEPDPTPSPTASPSPSAAPTPSPGDRGTYPVTPNDPHFGDDSEPLSMNPTQWGPRRIEAPQAWQEERATGDAIRVAVLDTGVDLQHEDLQCPGKLDAVDGSDVVADDSDPDDEQGHGTHVAGIIAACTNNGTGIAGVAPDATIVPIRVLNASGSGTDAQLISGINRAVAAGAHVINMSLAYPPGKEIVNDVAAIDAAIEAAVESGVVVIAAAGNEGLPLCSYPSLAEDIVCVGATDPRDLKSWYSNFPVKADEDDVVGPAVVAPGGTGQVFCDIHSEEILSLYPPELDDCDEEAPGYRDLNGTSMASPHAAGVAALVYDRVGGMRSAENARAVVDAIIAGVDDLGPPGYDPVFGEGRVNALGAVLAAGEGPDPDPSPSPSGSPSPSPSPSVDPSPSPSVKPSPSPTQSGSPSPSPSPSVQPSPSPSPTESPGTATTSISTQRDIVGYKRSFALSGVVETNGGCSGPVTVEIEKRVHGTDAYRSIATVRVDDDGDWSVTLRSKRSASYIARVHDTDDCRGEMSAPLDVLVRAEIDVKVPRRCKDKNVLRGKVRPGYEATRVILKRREGERWRKVDSDLLNAGSRFVLNARQCGRHRIVWPSQNEANERGRVTFRF